MVHGVREEGYFRSFEPRCSTYIFIYILARERSACYTPTMVARRRARERSTSHTKSWRSRSKGTYRSRERSASYCPWCSRLLVGAKNTKHKNAKYRICPHSSKVILPQDSPYLTTSTHTAHTHSSHTQLSPRAYPLHKKSRKFPLRFHRLIASYLKFVIGQLPIQGFVESKACDNIVPTEPVPELVPLEVHLQNVLPNLFRAPVQSRGRLHMASMKNVNSITTRDARHG